MSVFITCSRFPKKGSFLREKAFKMRQTRQPGWLPGFEFLEVFLRLLAENDFSGHTFT